MRILILATVGSLLLLAGCAPSTRGIPAVSPFDVSHYSGVWYEIARLPNRFEKGLTDISAEYTPLENGKIRVVNKGYNPAKDEWKSATATAKQIVEGELRVTFFWPFSAAYRVIALDPDYQNALVTSSRKNYLWILARQPSMAEADYQSLVEQARQWEFETEKLIVVDQTRNRAVDANLE